MNRFIALVAVAAACTPLLGMAQGPTGPGSTLGPNETPQQTDRPAASQKSGKASGYDTGSDSTAGTSTTPRSKSGKKSIMNNGPTAPNAEPTNMNNPATPTTKQ